jgi:hypothetical protein
LDKDKERWRDELEEEVGCKNCRINAVERVAEAHRGGQVPPRDVAQLEEEEGDTVM